MRISGSYHSASSFPLFLLFSVRSVYSAPSDDRYRVVNKNMRVVKSEHCIPPPAARGGMYAKTVGMILGVSIATCMREMVAAFSRVIFSQSDDLLGLLYYICAASNSRPCHVPVLTPPHSVDTRRSGTSIPILPPSRRAIQCLLWAHTDDRKPLWRAPWRGKARRRRGRRGGAHERAFSGVGKY